MKMPKTGLAGLALMISLFIGQGAVAETILNKNLPLPSGAPTADQIAEQVYFVNQFHGFKRYAITRIGKKKITVIINKAKGKKPTTLTVERYKKNDFGDGAVRSKELAIFRSGKLKGTGMLIVDFEDDAKSQSYAIWLPALRKIRRFAEPPHDDAWGGTDFTFGDVILRKPFHETHELLGKETFNDCLGTVELAANQQTKWSRRAKRDPACNHKGKEVYKLKSSPKRENWWYDNRVSYIDTKTFGDYRTEYFKGGEKIKVIDRDWVSLGKDDPRQLSWGYWYGKTLATGHETWAVIPQDAVSHDDAVDKPDGFFSERSLRKIKR